MPMQLVIMAITLAEAPKYGGQGGFHLGDIFRCKAGEIFFEARPGRFPKGPFIIRSLQLQTISTGKVLKKNLPGLEVK